MSIEFRIIDDRHAFGELRPDWNDLARRTPVDHAYVRHQWFANWWDHLPHGGDMRVLAGWRAGRLVAAAPLYVRREKRRGIGFDLLSFMQSGITPRSTFLVDPAEDPCEVFGALREIPGWDVAEFKGLEKEAELTRRFVDWLEGEGGCVVEPGALSPYQRMPADWPAFEKSRRKSYRKRFRNSLNRCEKAEGFGVRKIETASEFEACFEDLLTISRNSWKAEGGTDLVTQRGMAEFFRGFVRDTADEGLWVLHLLSLEGKPVSFGFAVRHGDSMVLLRWEFDDEYRYYMPGVVVHVHAIRDLLAHHPGGEYDLSGAGTEFKSGLVDDVREHIDVTFGRNGVKSRMLMGMKRGLQSLRGSGDDSPPEEA